MLIPGDSMNVGSSSSAVIDARPFPTLLLTTSILEWEFWGFISLSGLPLPPMFSEQCFCRYFQGRRSALLACGHPQATES